MPDYSLLSEIPRPTRENINKPLDSDGNTYLHLLCKFNAPLSMIREALAMGAELDILNKQKIPPLAFAITKESREITECLVDARASLFFPVGKDGNFNALFLAVSVSNDDICKLLIQKGAGRHVNKTGMDQYGRDDGWVCLHRAINRDRFSLIESLVKAGAFINQEAGPMRLTPLQRAAMSGSLRALEALLLCGANIETKNSQSGMTALHYAAFHREPDALNFLLAHGADPDAENSAGTTALMMACANGDLAMCRTLVRYRADVNKQQYGEKKETALIMAAQRYNAVDIIEILLKANANPLLSDSFNRKASYHAQQYSMKSVLEQAEKEAERRYFDKAYRDVYSQKCA